jgi:hypothetical protein
MRWFGKLKTANKKRSTRKVPRFVEILELKSPR